MLRRRDVGGWLFVVLASTASPLLASPVLDGPEIPVNAETANDQDSAVVAVHTDGSFVVAFESFDEGGSMNDVFVRRFDAAGAPLAAEVRVNTYTTDDQEDPSIAMHTDGSFVIVWDSWDQDGDQRGIYAQRFDVDGSPVGAEIPVNEFSANDQNDGVVAVQPGGGFVVGWENDGGGPQGENLAARRFDADALPLAGNFPLNTTVALDQEDLALGTDSTGAIVAVWESELQDGDFDSVVVRRFSDLGTPLGGESIVNTSTAGDQDDPSLSVLPDGRFVVVWEDAVQDGDGDGIYAQFFDASGMPVGGEHQVSTATAGDQRDPWVAIDASGAAVVVWQTEVPPPVEGMIENGVFVERVTATGGAEGASRQVDSSSGDPRLEPVIARNASGRVVVVWEDLGGSDGAGNGVFARRLRDLPFLDGFEDGTTDGWAFSVP